MSDDYRDLKASPFQLKRRRRATRASPRSPRAIKPRVEGSGTAVESSTLTSSTKISTGTWYPANASNVLAPVASTLLIVNNVDGPPGMTLVLLGLVVGKFNISSTTIPSNETCNPFGTVNDPSEKPSVYSQKLMSYVAPGVVLRNWPNVQKNL